MVYIWLSEQQCPGQQLNWYLLGVRNHLHHRRSSGLSLDSPKHDPGRVASAYDWDGPESLECDEGIMSEVNAHDIFSLLAGRLKPLDRIILRDLDEGFRVWEIAEKLHVPDMFVIRHRRQIAELAMKLRIDPVNSRPP